MFFEDIEKKREDLNKQLEEKKISFDEFEKLSDKIDEEEDKRFEEIAEKAAEDYCKKEKEFLNYSYENSDSYTLMFHVADGKTERGLWVDDFGYGDWQSQVPEGWSWERYVNAMEKLEDLFQHLAYFQHYYGKHFPENELFVKMPNGKILQLHYIVGQGSDFAIYPIEADHYYWIFDLQDLEPVAKMSTYEQAKWYTENCLWTLDGFNLVNDSNRSKAMFALGQSTVKGGFFERLNSNNFEKVLAEL